MNKKNKYLLAAFTATLLITTPAFAKDKTTMTTILAKPTVEKLQLKVNEPSIFAVSAVNKGKPANVTVTPERSNLADHIVLSICETGKKGTCLGKAHESLVTRISDENISFAVFATATKPLTKGEDHSIQVRFEDSSGALLWQTDTEVTTN